MGTGCRRWELWRTVRSINGGFLWLITRQGRRWSRIFGCDFHCGLPAVTTVFSRFNKFRFRRVVLLITWRNRRDGADGFLALHLSCRNGGFIPRRKDGRIWRIKL